MLPRVIAASLLALVLCLPWAGPAAAQGSLTGTFEGVDDAAGASIVIERADEGLAGTFFDAHGNSQRFEATLSGGTAEAMLDMDQRRVAMRMAPLPYGLRVVLAPVDAEGNLNLAAGRVLHFVREGLDVPTPDPDFVRAPEHGRGRITANSFLASYEFWSPEGVRNGYLSLPDRFRTLMRLFPAVQLDVIWKLCLAPEADRALAAALRGQGVTCGEVLDGIANAQRTGRFEEYKAEVRDERRSLRTNVRCADGYPMPRAECERAAERLSAQALALDNAATVLARYR